jgi:hypothetical protein
MINVYMLIATSYIDSSTDCFQEKVLHTSSSARSLSPSPCVGMQRSTSCVSLSTSPAPSIIVTSAAAAAGCNVTSTDVIHNTSPAIPQKIVSSTETVSTSTVTDGEPSATCIIPGDELPTSFSEEVSQSAVQGAANESETARVSDVDDAQSTLNRTCVSATDDISLAAQDDDVDAELEEINISRQLDSSSDRRGDDVIIISSSTPESDDDFQ